MIVLTQHLAFPRLSGLRFGAERGLRPRAVAVQLVSAPGWQGTPGRAEDNGVIGVTTPPLSSSSVRAGSAPLAPEAQGRLSKVGRPGGPIQVQFKGKEIFLGEVGDEERRRILAFKKYLKHCL